MLGSKRKEQSGMISCHCPPGIPLFQQSIIPSFLFCGAMRSKVLFLLTPSELAANHTFMAEKIRVGALISGGGTNLQAIIDACNSDRIDAKVVFAGSDNPQAYGLERAKKHGIPTFVVDYKAIIDDTNGRSLEDLVPKDFDLETVLSRQGVSPAVSEREKVKRYFCTRAIAEAALLREMASYPFDLLVLAGFMRIVTPYFIDHINTDLSRPRIMNIHPAARLAGVRSISLTIEKIPGLLLDRRLLRSRLMTPLILLGRKVSGLNTSFTQNAFSCLRRTA